MEKCRGGGVEQVYVDSDRSESFFCCAWSLHPATRDPILAVAGQARQQRTPTQVSNLPASIVLPARHAL
jgi:hypothetical protein